MWLEVAMGVQLLAWRSTQLNVFQKLSWLKLNWCSLKCFAQFLGRRGEKKPQKPKPELHMDLQEKIQLVQLQSPS